MNSAKRMITGIALFLIFSSALHGGENINPKKAEADAAQLLKDLGTLQDAIRALRGGGSKKAAASKGSDTNQAQNEMDKLTKFEKEVLTPIQARFDNYAKTYGNSRAAIDQKFQQILGRQLRQRPSWAWEMLAPELEKARGLRSDAADSLFRDAKRTLEHMQHLNKNIWAKSFDKAKNNLETALKFDPKNEEAKALLATVDQKKSEALAKLEAEIEKAEWKPHSPRFNGPGDPNELARIAFEQLRIDDDGKVSDGVLAVRIRGDWRVWDEVLGIPKNYGLPIEVAYAIKAEPNNASVLSLTMITRENKKEPPFRNNPGVGDAYKIRISKIPGMTGGAAPFFLFRLGLAALLILSGVVAGSSLLQPLNPSLGAAIERITPLKALVGVITLGVGVIFFVKNLLYLSPFADLLPQIAAVVIGLLLGLELLLKAKIPSSGRATNEPLPGEPDSKSEEAAKDEDSSESSDAAPEAAGEAASKQIYEAAEKTKEAGEAAAQKLQDMLAGQQDKIKALRKHQVRLGIACIALGLLHLLAAGWWLF